MSRAPKPAKIPYANAKAYGMVHRILRTLARSAKTIAEIKNSLNSDGYLRMMQGDISSDVHKLARAGLLTVDDGPNASARAHDSLFDISTIGITALAALEAKVNPHGQDHNPPATGTRQAVDATPAVNPADTCLLTTRQRNRAASAADLAPAAPRPGSHAALSTPSRIGNRLHYRDGRITTMDGTTLKKARS